MTHQVDTGQLLPRAKSGDARRCGCGKNRERRQTTRDQYQRRNERAQTARPTLSHLPLHLLSPESRACIQTVSRVAILWQGPGTKVNALKVLFRTWLQPSSPALQPGSSEVGSDGGRRWVWPTSQGEWGAPRKPPTRVTPGRVMAGGRGREDTLADPGPGPGWTAGWTPCSCLCREREQGDLQDPAQAGRPIVALN